MYAGTQRGRIPEAKKLSDAAPKSPSFLNLGLSLFWIYDGLETVLQLVVLQGLLVCTFYVVKR